MKHSQPFNIGIFISSLSIGNEIDRIAQEKRDRLRISHRSLEEAIEVARVMEQEGIEVIISRRGTANLLRENLQTPVLSFPQSSLSILTSIKRAADKLKNLPGKQKKIFLPSSGAEIQGLEIVGELLDVEFKQGVYSDSESLERIIYNAAQERFVTVIGGAATMRYAEKYGLHYQELKTPLQDILETIENARSVAQSNREEKAAAHRYQSIMNLASDGIISVDSTGRVRTINEKAKHVLKLQDSEVIGKSIATLVDDRNLVRMFQKQTSLQNRIEQIGDELFICNQEPLKIEDQFVGVVSTMREASNVMRAENEVRKSLTKGFVAHYGLDDLIYSSPKMHNLVATCRELGKSDSTVLVMGETGTGKEVVAQSIHQVSHRKQRVFVSVHCGALPEQLLESELFGHEEGAFTGSKKGGKAGLFEMAHQGTIFLDEVDSTSQNVQLRLLRVLQEKEVMRVGGDRKIPVDVRVIAAAGKDLWSAVVDGHFRKDLFFRLNVIRMSIPPLKERREDIPKLMNHFIHHYSKKLGVLPIELPEYYMQTLSDYSWPGNVRQLKHFAEQLTLNSTFPFSTATLDSLIRELQLIVDPMAGETKDAPQELTVITENLATPGLDAETIRKALRLTHYSRTEAAKLLGISRTTLWRKMKQLPEL